MAGAGRPDHAAGLPRPVVHVPDVIVLEKTPVVSIGVVERGGAGMNKGACDKAFRAATLTVSTRRRGMLYVWVFSEGQLTVSRRRDT